MFQDEEDKQQTFHAKKHIRKRSANGTDIYGHLAGISGGSVIHADKDNISKAVDVLSTVTLVRIIEILFFFKSDFFIIKQYSCIFLPCLCLTHIKNVLHVSQCC